jgi:hypothetical protein
MTIRRVVGRVIADILAMSVQVDKAGRNDMAAGVDHDISFEREFADGHDLVPVDGDVANGIKAGFWINDTAICNDDVICLGHTGCEQKAEQQEYEGIWGLP